MFVFRFLAFVSELQLLFIWFLVLTDFSIFFLLVFSCSFLFTSCFLLPSYFLVDVHIHWVFSCCNVHNIVFQFVCVCCLRHIAYIFHSIITWGGELCNINNVLFIYLIIMWVWMHNWWWIVVFVSTEGYGIKPSTGCERIQIGINTHESKITFNLHNHSKCVLHFSVYMCMCVNMIMVFSLSSLYDDVLWE